MRSSKSVWARSINHLLGTPPSTAKRRKANRSAPGRRHVFERLEDRTVLSATFGSALSFGNDTGSTAAQDVATDQAGNSYLTGYFSGTVDFDQAASHAGDTDILTARGPQDIFVAKYAPDDSLVWVQRMGGDAQPAGGNAGNLSDVGRKITLDGSGNVYVVGKFIGSGDFGSTTLSTAGDVDGFVEKLNAAGTVQWATRWGSTANDFASGIGVDATGNVYALGYHLVGPNYNYDIVKFSSAGAAVWSEAIAAQTGYSSHDLAVSASGNVYVAGSFKGTVDFDPGSKTNYVSSGTNHAGFVLKLDTNGKFGWVSPFVGQTTSAFSTAQSIALDGSGNVVVGGSYYGSVDFKPGSGTVTLPTIGGAFITKLNSSGGLVWARALESSVTPVPFVYGLAVDTAGNIYASGPFYGTVDLDPGAGVYSRTPTGSSDVYLVQLTAAGNFGWAATLGETGSVGINGIAVDPNGTVHVAGAYQDTVDFDPDPFATYDLTTPGTFSNGFRLRLSQV